MNKTQICNLINGEKNVIRDINHAKYNGMDPLVISGTSYEERKAVAEKVISENPEEMDVLVKDTNLHLKRSASTTGLTHWYQCTLTDEQYRQIIGEYPNKTSEFQSSFYLADDMKVRIVLLKRKNERCIWRVSCSYNIGEEFVTIL